MRSFHISALIGLLLASGCRTTVQTDMLRQVEARFGTAEARVRSIRHIGTVDGMDIYHVQQVITDMLSPRGVNHLVMFIDGSLVDKSWSCSTDPVVLGSTMYPNGPGHEGDIYLIHHESLVRVVSDSK